MVACCQIILSQTLVVGLDPKHEETERACKYNGARQDLNRTPEPAILMPTPQGTKPGKVILVSLVVSLKTHSVRAYTHRSDQNTCSSSR